MEKENNQIEQLHLTAKGNAEAQYNLGVAYSSGEGVAEETTMPRLREPAGQPGLQKGIIHRPGPAGHPFDKDGYDGNNDNQQ